MDLLRKLKNAGCVTRVTHKRLFKTAQGGVTKPQRKSEGNSHNILPHGGETTVKITLPDGEEFIETVKCSPKDPYTKSVGRNLAIRRLLRRLRKSNAFRLPKGS